MVGVSSFGAEVSMVCDGWVVLTISEERKPPEDKAPRAVIATPQARSWLLVEESQRPGMIHQIHTLVLRSSLIFSTIHPPAPTELTPTITNDGRKKKFQNTDKATVRA